MTSALKHYLANGGTDYIASPDYERRRLALAEKMAAGPVSLAEMVATLGLPLPVVVDLLNAWRAEAEANGETKH